MRASSPSILGRPIGAALGIALASLAVVGALELRAARRSQDDAMRLDPWTHALVAGATLALAAGVGWGARSRHRASVARLAESEVAADLLRKHAEAEARYRALIEKLPAVVYEAPVSPAGVLLIPEGLMRSFLGYPESERPSQTAGWWREALHQDDRERVYAAWARALETGAYACEHRIRRKDGRYVWLDSRGRVVTEPDGSRVMHGFAVDVTERAEAAAALERQTKHVAALSEVAQALARARDPSEVIAEICAGLCRVFGYDGASFFELDAARQNITARFGANVTAEDMAAVSLPLSALPSIARILETGLPQEHGDLAADPDDIPPALIARFRARSTMGAPVFGNDGRPLGVLVAYASKGVRVLAKEERALYVAFANLAGGAIQRARLLEQVERDRNELRRVSAQALAATEAERARVARELHDEVGQSLVALALRLDVLGRHHGLGPVAAQEARDLVQVARAALGELRQLARDLRPAALDDLGLGDALRGLARRFRRDSGGEEEESGPLVSVEAPQDLPRLSPALETALYRIAQEAVANAIRHGSPARVDIALAVEGDCVRFEVRDDGCGFDAAEVRQGIGLASIRERAALVQGDAEIVSAPGAGTRVRVTAPLASRARPAGGAHERAADAGPAYEGAAR